MGEMEKEMKRLQHHISVLSKRNYWLVKDGKSRAASPIASYASLSESDKELEEVGMSSRQYKFTMMATEEELGDLFENIRTERKTEESVNDGVRRVEERGRIGNVVVVESVALVEEAEVAEPVVRLPVAVKGEGSKKGRVEVGDSEEEMEKVEGVLIAPLGPRAECGGLLRRVGKESVFAGANSIRKNITSRLVHLVPLTHGAYRTHIMILDAGLRTYSVWALTLCVRAQQA